MKNNTFTLAFIFNICIHETFDYLYSQIGYYIIFFLVLAEKKIKYLFVPKELRLLLSRPNLTLLVKS